MNTAAANTNDAPSVDNDVLVRLQEQTGDEDGELLNELVSVFVEDAEETCERLQGLVSEGPAEVISREAHRLKSGAANLGAVRMMALCKELEMVGASADVETLTGLVTRLTAELADARVGLQAYLDALTHPQAAGAR